MSFLVTSLGGKDPREIMVDSATIAGTAAEIAAVIGGGRGWHDHLHGRIRHDKAKGP